MTVYSLYGLTLKSDVPLPCPRVESDGLVPDVDLCECSAQELSAACDRVSKSLVDDGFWQSRTFEDETAHVYWRDHFEFVVSSDGRRVLWRKLHDVPDEVFLTYFTGQVLSYCLLMRGIESLHATAIVIDGEAVAFLGDSGDGKSTLAASFLSRGYSLLTDDVLVFEFHKDRVLTHSSVASIKLTPESADAMFNGRRAIPMNSFTSKMIFPLQASQHVRDLVRLRVIYVLPGPSYDSKIAVRRLLGRASFLPLIQNTFNNVILGRSRIQQQFAFAERLVRLVPIKQLSYPKGLDLIPRVADKILADLKD